MRIALYVLAVIAFLVAIAATVFIFLCIISDWFREDGPNSYYDGCDGGDEK
ncbi:MAG: hypothetical protein IJ168_08280 [Eubacterium sp.]|nr:hypothetical protein [Eubacterium sp.]